LMNKKNRTILLLHWRAKCLSLNAHTFRYSGIVLILLMISFLTSALIQSYLYTSFLWINKYFDMFDVKIFTLLILSFSVYLLSKLLFYVFNTYKWIHPFSFLVIILWLSFVLQKNGYVLFHRETLLMGLSIVLFLILLKSFLVGYINISHNTLIKYTNLSPWMLIDEVLLRDRYSINIYNSWPITVENIDKIQTTINDILDKNPTLVWDVLVVRRFILSPFIVSALFFTILNKNILLTTFFMLKFTM
jgi:hypothetical protein